MEEKKKTKQGGNLQERAWVQGKGKEEATEMWTWRSLYLGLSAGLGARALTKQPALGKYKDIAQREYSFIKEKDRTKIRGDTPPFEDNMTSQGTQRQTSPSWNPFE